MVLKAVIPTAKLANSGIIDSKSRIVSLFFVSIEKISDTTTKSPYKKLKIRFDDSKSLKSDILVTVSINSTR